MKTSADRSLLRFRAQSLNRIQGRTVWHETVTEMQAALDAFLLRYNRERPHQGRGMNGRTPWQAFRDGLPVRPQPEPEEPPQPIAA